MAPVAAASADISAKIVVPKPRRRDVRNGSAGTVRGYRAGEMRQAATMSDEPVAVGLIGAGPWATLVHAPVLAASPRTRLAGVWARRPEAAAELAERHGTTAYASV